MQPLTTYDLVLNIFVVVIMPLLIVANLKNWGASPLNVYLWRENPNLMRVSLVILGLLTLYSLVQLAGHFGLVSPAVVDYALPAIGIPVLIAAIADIWLVVKAISQYMRTRRSQA
jgi:hypothetical protein